MNIFLKIQIIINISMIIIIYLLNLLKISIYDTENLLSFPWAASVISTGE